MKPSVKQMEKRLDDIARDVVFARDRNRCAYCGVDIFDKALDWAHIHTRGWKAMRWDSDNAIALCKGCHMKWHGIIPGYEKEMRYWWENTYPSRCARLNIALNTRHKIDRMLIEVALRQEFRQLTGLDWYPVR